MVRVAIAAALVALVGVGCVGCRDRDAARPATSSTGSAGSATGRPAIASAPTAAPPRPSLPPPSPGADAGVLTVAQTFDAEPVDRTWNTVAEHKIRQRVKGAEVACRQTLCSVTMTGSEAEVTRALDELQALREIAQSVLLTAPEVRDGKQIVSGYVKFDRPDTSEQ